jgi:hypothetical protein
VCSSACSPSAVADRDPRPGPTNLVAEPGRRRELAQAGQMRALEVFVPSVGQTGDLEVRVGFCHR